MRAGREFRTDVEGLRAVAVIAVVLYHAGVPGFGGGFVGVDAFFVVSGFLITGLLWRELRETGRVSLPAFYARRVRRLLPAAVLVLVVTAVASSYWLPPLQARVVGKDAMAAALYAANYRFAAMRTDYLTADAPPSPLQHYWSLGAEEQFYLVWPPLLLLAAWLARRRAGRHARDRPVIAVALGLVGAVSFGLSLWLTVVAQPWAFFSLPARAWELALGGAVALAVPVLRRLPRPAAATLGWLGLGALAVAIVRLGETTPFPGLAALLPTGGTAAVLVAGCAAPHFGPDVALRRRPFQFAGKLSYSWYLWHWPVLVLAPVVAGGPLSLWWRLALAAGSGVLALATVRWVEDPARFSPWLRRRPRRSLATGVALTAVAVGAVVASGVSAPSPRGRLAELAPIEPRAGVAGKAVADAGVGPTAEERAVVRAVASGVRTREVPSNLEPSLEGAYGDKPRVFVDGCHADFTDTGVRSCVYGDQRSSTTVVLFGDSHAGQWFPALERAAKSRRWRLVSLTKSTCTPFAVPLWSPVLHRPYRECDRWREAALRRIRAERPAAVVAGSARHYGSEYRFGKVYSPVWLSGLRAMVGSVRATGSPVVVLSPTPRPKGNVPDCLSEHLSDAAACMQPRARAVDAAGLGAEREVVRRAGGTYVDVTPWACTRASCAVVVGNLLVYRDDNHFSRAYPAWLAPAVAAEIERVLPAAATRGGERASQRPARPGGPR